VHFSGIRACSQAIETIDQNSEGHDCWTQLCQAAGSPGLPLRWTASSLLAFDTLLGL